MAYNPGECPVCCWETPPSNLCLPQDEVHVWRATLDAPAAHQCVLKGVLAADEIRRADRIRFPQDRRRFVIARGTLRILLGRYLGQEPSSVYFQYGDYGKPSIVPMSGQDELRFNVSHSDGLALYAFARGREVGVDLERMRPMAQSGQIAARFFSPRENAALQALDAGLQEQAFYACWTRKEAYIKARGQGLSLALDQFDVSLRPGEPARLLETRGDQGDVQRWSLQELQPGLGYAGAVAVEGGRWQLRCWQYPDRELPAREATIC